MDNFELGQQEDPAAVALRQAQFAARVDGVRRHWPWVVAALIIGCGIGYGVSFGFKPTYQATTVFIPPQQQSGAASALQSLGALSSLVGGAGVKSSADQYVSMMQSVTIADHIIDHFDLRHVYETPYRDEARKALGKRVQIAPGKKDGLITVIAEDTDPKRAAAIANRFVDELRIMTSHLAVTEAQQRRVFFEHLLNDTKQRLIEAQVAVEGSGISESTLKAEPRTAADAYAKLHAELTAAQVKLQVLHGSLADTSAEVMQQSNVVNAVNEQVRRLEATQSSLQASPGYISKYRDFKYQETLFDLYSKQYELARLDEAREGALIQVVDEAQPAEHKHFPRRSLFAAVAGLLAAGLFGGFFWRRAVPKA